MIAPSSSRWRSWKRIWWSRPHCRRGEAPGRRIHDRPSVGKAVTRSLVGTAYIGGYGSRRSPGRHYYFFPYICAVSFSIAIATSRHCVSQLRGKRKIRSAPSTRRSVRHMPGVAASRVHRALIARAGRGEHILVGVGRAFLEGAQGQSVLDLRRGLLEIARIDGAHAHVGRQRIAMRRDRDEDAVDRLRLLVHVVGADMLLPFRRLQRGPGEGKIDPLLRAGMLLDLAADRSRRHVEQGAADADRQAFRRARRDHAPGRPQQIGNECDRAHCQGTARQDGDEMAARIVA